MNQVFGKVGSYWFNQKATKQLDNVSDNVNTVSNNVEGGTSWLVNKIKGTGQKPLPELLKENDMATGIFPKNIASYDFDEKTKRLTVKMSSFCEVGYKDSTVLRFSTEVSGYLEKGRFTDIEGIKTKVTMIWCKVTLITDDGPKLHFTAGLKKTRSKEAYDVVRDGITVTKY